MNIFFGFKIEDQIFDNLLDISKSYQEDFSKFVKDEFLKVAEERNLAWKNYEGDLSFEEWKKISPKSQKLDELGEERERKFQEIQTFRRMKDSYIKSYAKKKYNIEL